MDKNNRPRAMRGKTQEWPLHTRPHTKSEIFNLLRRSSVRISLAQQSIPGRAENRDDSTGNNATTDNDPLFSPYCIISHAFRTKCKQTNKISDILRVFLFYSVDLTIINGQSYANNSFTFTSGGRPRPVSLCSGAFKSLQQTHVIRMGAKRNSYCK